MTRDEDRALAALEAEIAEVCGVLNVAHGRLVCLTARAIEAGLWRGVGIRSVEHWLTMRAGLSYRSARQVARLATRVGELPHTVGALSGGEITVDQAAAVADTAPAHADGQAAGYARVMTVTQLRGTLSRYAFAEPPGAVGDDADEAGADKPGGDAEGSAADRRDAEDRARREAAAAPGRAAMSYDGLRFVLQVDGPADAGALVEKALAECHDALFHAGHPDVTLYDAVAELANRSLSGAGSSSRRDKYRIYVHLDTAGGWLNAGPALPASLLAKISCDGVLQPVWETEGAPVNVGRAQRIVPERTRRLILDRDRGCRVPGCGATRHLEIHHIVHWRDGGQTITSQLVAMCPHDHDAHHRGEFTIVGDADKPDGLRFIGADGHLLRAVTPPTPPAAPPLPPTTAPQAPWPLIAVPAGGPFQPPSGERVDHWSIWFPEADSDPGMPTASPSPDSGPPPGSEPGRPSPASEPGGPSPPSRASPD